MSAVESCEYQPGDLEACRGLWVECTEWHRQLCRALDIGRDSRGLLFHEHPECVGSECVLVAEVGRPHRRPGRA